MNDIKKINELLTRGVVDVIVKESLEKKLKSGKKLRIKLGIDPTGTDLHLGHAVVLRKLRQFQDAGHQVILLIGGFTATIGDPTGKNEARPPLTLKQVEENSKNFLKQTGKVLDLNKVEVRNNRDWFEKMNFEEIIKLCAQNSSSQISARKDFSDRLKKGKEVFMHELFYPIMQGYDSVMLECDVEIGGTDQLFNLLVGRDLQKKYNCKTQQDILTVPILEGLDGIEKMSKSLGNYIALDDEPNEMFGKTMSIPDNLMLKYFELCTDEDLDEMKKLIKKNPRDAKVHLAKTIVALYYNITSANSAEQDFITKFVKKEEPEHMKEFEIGKKEISILDLIVSVTKFAPSTSEARRLIKGGGVTFGNNKITDPNQIVSISGEQILKIGKRKFARIKM